MWHDEDSLFAIVWLFCVVVALGMLVMKLARTCDQLMLELYVSEIENRALFEKVNSDGSSS
jgi:hypothetical protein